LLNFYIGLWLLFNIALSIDVAISIATTSEAKKIDKINNFTGSNGKKFDITIAILKTWPI
jgi:hypothetical protein